jgi:hypothetical protein
MITNPSDYLKSYNEWNAERKDNAQLNFYKRVIYTYAKITTGEIQTLQAVLKSLDRNASLEEVRNAVISVTACGIPDWLITDHSIKVTPIALLKNPTTTAAVVNFYKRIKDTDNGSLALVFHLIGVGPWVVHNLQTGSKPSNFHINIETTGAVSSNLKLEPLKTFAEANR